MIYCQSKESVVLEDREWCTLRYKNIQTGSCTVMTAKAVYSDVPIEVCSWQYRENIDYEIDYAAGRIRRCSGSSIKSHTESVFYHVNDFNQEDRSGYFGNYEFMVYVTYRFEGEGNTLTEDIARKITKKNNCKRLVKTIKKLTCSQPVKYLVYGDSISTGCEALTEEDTYFYRFLNLIKNLSGSDVFLHNKSIGGETSQSGAERFFRDISLIRPDLVSIAYGMNDMCERNGQVYVTISQFRTNISSMIEQSLRVNAEVILLTPCLPNPRWIYSNPNVKEYAQVLRELAKEYDISLADVQALWETELKLGKSHSSLLVNDINHPSSYGHYLYYCMLENCLKIGSKES